METDTNPDPYIAGDAATIAGTGACSQCLISFGVDPQIASVIAVAGALLVRLVIGPWVQAKLAAYRKGKEDAPK